MNSVRMGIIGLGNIGLHHAGYLRQGQVEGATLAAISDVRPDHARRWVEESGATVEVFDTAEALINSGTCDAVIIATPSPLHPPLAIRAFAQGLHVLVEKPAGTCAGDVRAMNAAAVQSGKVFGIQFAQRMMPAYQKARELIAAGALGELQRTQWTSTKWYRTQDYYDSGGWRGTWSGEGGGVLVNQSPHDLDIWIWLCGLPVRVRAFCRFGQWHAIEVEDDVTAYVEYSNGASGVFICSTGEFPGTNRLEIVGDLGTLTVQDGCQLEFRRLNGSARKHCREAKGFSFPEASNVEVVLAEQTSDNIDNTRNFVNAVLHGAALVAPGVEGLNSIELSNAMQLSTWLGEAIELPTDALRYRAALEEKIRSSQVRKPDVVRTLDVAASWR
ncbi:MAG: Gfo/Idh/MocA family oxidoreductase [bacterium]